MTWRVLLLVGMCCFAAAAAGAGVRATYGARTTADEPQYLLSASSLAADGDLDIGDELASGQWRAYHEADLPGQTRLLPGGGRVSPHGPLLPVLLSGPVWLGGWLGGKLALAAVAGLLGAATTWTAVRRFGVRPSVAALTTVVFGVSAPTAVYGNQVYPEIVAALAVVGALAAVTGPLERRGVWLLGAAVVALPWLAVKYVPVAAAFGGIGLVRLAREGRAAAGAGLAAGLVAAAAVFVVVHLAIYTGVTPYAAADHFAATGEFSAVGFAPNLAGRSQRLLGLLVGERFGLAAWQPAWLLALPALGALARARPPGWVAVVLPLAAGWLNATFVALTAQGYWFPGRQVVVVLPCAVLAVAWWVARSPWRPRVLAATGLLGLLAYGWLIVEATTGRRTLVVDFFDTANPLYRVWRVLLPDYLQPDPWTWPLHGLWLVAALALLALGWHVAGGTTGPLRVRCPPRAGAAPGRASRSDPGAPAARTRQRPQR